MVFLTKPEAPTSLTAQANNSNIIYLTWTKGVGANNTYIERNTITSWSRGSGTNIYNGPGTSYEDTGLNEGTIYYYQAWSLAQWTNPALQQYSDNYDSANAKTNNEPKIILIYPLNGSIDANVTPTCQIDANDGY